MTVTADWAHYVLQVRLFLHREQNIHDPEFASISLECRREFEEKFGDLCLSISDDQPFMVPVTATVHSVAVAIEVQRWLAERFRHRVGMARCSVDGCNRRPSIAHARWIAIEGTWYDPEEGPKGQEALTPRAVSCEACGWLDDGRFAEPLRLHSSVLKAGGREFFVAHRGLWVVHERVLRLLEEFAPGEFASGPAVVEGAGPEAPRMWWVRPLHAIGGLEFQKTAGPRCERCHRPANRYTFDTESARFLGGMIVSGYGSWRGNVATLGTEPDEAHAGAYQSIWHHFLVMSGGLFTLLQKHGVRGFRSAMSPAYSAPVISYDPAEPTWEQEPRFQDAIREAGRKRRKTKAASKGTQKRSKKDRTSTKPMNDKLTEAVAAHVRRHIGEPDQVLHELVPDDPHIDVLVVRPRADRPFYTLVTCGMSSRPMTLPEGVTPEEHGITPFVELMLCLPADWKLDRLTDSRWGWPVEWLRRLARYPHESKDLLYVGHTVPNGDPPEPFTEGTDLCCWFLHPPHTVDPEAFLEMEVGKKKVLFLAVSAIHESEMNFLLAHEPEEAQKLDEALQEAGASELLDLKRSPVNV